MSTTAWGPTLAMRWAYAQLTEPAVASRSDSTPAPGSALLVVHGSNGGRVAVHGEEPSRVSFGEYPASSAAARVISLNVDPGWRPGWSVTRLYWKWSKPGPPTI